MVKVGDIVIHNERGMVTKVVSIEGDEIWGNWAYNMKEFKEGKTNPGLQFTNRRYVSRVKLTLKQLMEEL